jgi:hypothetical protein
MNRNVVLFHLHEAAEQLNETIQKLEGSADYATEEFQVDMGHLYHHLNTAWNGRDQTDDEFAKCTDDSFKRFRQFPKASELFLDC